MRDDLTAIVLTLNEEKHLSGCLASLQRLDCAILVLDSGSTDRTVAIAQEAGAAIEARPFDGYANQRNAALDMVDTPWVLFLDADERLTPDGCNELLAVLDGVANDVTTARIPRRNIVFGRALRGGGWWPDHQTRLLRRGAAAYDARRQVHEVVESTGRSVDLATPLIHLNYETRAEFIAKQRRYTKRAAKQAVSEGHVPRRRAFLSAPVRELVRRFVQLHGYRDGIIGLFLATALAIEQVRWVWLCRRGAF
ncbi:MAG: glycosyltransferase family 2 protein [Thermomicrobiales bacterium]|nr:glycosyltransferase family 2 protein [Thermomicrobiales bacterium]